MDRASRSIWAQAEYIGRDEEAVAEVVRDTTTLVSLPRLGRRAPDCLLVCGMYEAEYSVDELSKTRVAVFERLYTHVLVNAK